MGWTRYSGHWEAKLSYGGGVRNCFRGLVGGGQAVSGGYARIWESESWNGA